MQAEGGVLHVSDSIAGLSALYAAQTDASPGF
jgi:hypothetical protein